MGFGAELHWTRAHSEQHLCYGDYSGNKESGARTLWRPSIHSEHRVWRKSGIGSGLSHLRVLTRFFDSAMGGGISPAPVLLGTVKAEIIMV